ncbi:hypothetical protein IQ260_18325 [Leptolyngbya cf. ectocarpi LEGE 11479]|uniref:Uncharacterized protein n=1 Tax=Leptolyngbya cf. ectocarpi LEGE 11479 TaxID=1828722 RepID=A0A928ZW81_LEPEC|nr:hypothetical protein [Leptolyngbya ectocarpi]MBE9068606.1 hypothetical protein [Leptolyngbya cf. ectocarpi LEGE 11479]
MNSTYSDVRQDVLSDMSAHSGGHHTAQSIAEAYNVSDSTIRNRWFPWLKKIAPESLLKSGKGYTDLACTLFSEFAEVKHCDRKSWVTDAKTRYSHEWASAGVIEGELMPEEVGNVLALRQTQTNELELSVAQQLQSLESLIDQTNTAESNLSEADLKAAVTRGQQRAVMLYQAELQAELQTINSLKQRRMGGGE